ncbi:MAG TPA: [protein-PII] uridylyltransferase [Methylophilus sp.]|nr:[protein-PII] uridylyltransferase [Methylophilus sp.]HQQ33587.1 [protein-PII] uridylyltransferase [Methylophilus sp.]
MTDTFHTAQYWRAQLRTAQQSLKAEFYTHPNAIRCLQQRTSFVDKVLRVVWQASNIFDDTCLIAVGGYGRGELFPHSDIDILILPPESPPPELNAKIEALVTLLWDIGLSVGHSVRTTSECIQEATQDVTVMTNLLESRLLSGNVARYQEFKCNYQACIDQQAFLQAKIREQDQRHSKFNDTEYNLEPNLKESPGGLRDLHMILWVAESQGLGATWADLHQHKLISLQEMRALRRHERKLQLLRIRLHLLANRREDRLLFDFQHELATELGYVNNPKRRASEALMNEFYRSAKHISLMNEILLKALAEKFALSDRHEPIGSYFIAKNQVLDTLNEQLFEQHPEAIFQSFLILQQRADITAMSASLVRQLQQARGRINQSFRRNPLYQKQFLDILQQTNGVHHSLRRMNRYGILGAYIPVFGKIIGQMQHDLFHVYTVDEHILNVLANLRRFSKPELKHEFPLCSSLFEQFEKPYLLYLAALFHDIAKGRGGDHSELGTIDARSFCKLHDLAKEDTELVAWLVEAHLVMSRTAQKSDLGDPNVIESFASFVQNDMRLVALYLLTVADIRGTSPAVWNAWKANLLQNLFQQTRKALHGSVPSISQMVFARRAEAEEKLIRFGLQPTSYQALWQAFGEDYFTRYEADEIAWQSRLLTPHLNTPTPIVRARHSPNGEGIQVMIYTLDQVDLFARICTFFGNMGYSIAQAKIFTTQNGYALNQFIILYQDIKSISYSGLLKYIEQELTIAIQANTIETRVSGRVKRQVKFTPFETQINIQKIEKTSFYDVEMILADRPGLLANIAYIFLKHGIDLHSAKINTLGNRAEDHFVVSGMHGHEISSQGLRSLTDDLLVL